MTATVLPIGRVAKVKSGYAFKSTDWQADGVPVVKIANVRDGRVTLEGCSFVSEEVAHSARAFELREGDILISMTGYIGEIGRVRSQGRMLLNQRVGRFAVTQPDRLCPDFLYYALQDPDLKQRFIKHGYGAAQPNISPTLIEQQEITLPSLDEQRRIAGILSAYDDLIENCQRRIRILEEMARRLYREWFVHFRYPGHESIPLVDSPLGPIPQGWDVVAFTDIADVLSGGTPRTENPDFWNGDIPFFTPKDAPSCFYVAETEKHVTPAGLARCASEHYPPDTVFITARGTVGKVALPAVPMAMNQSCYALRGKAGTPQQYLFLMVLEQVAYLQKNTGGATFDTIVIDTFRRMQVLRPAQPVVESFARLVATIFDQVRTLQATGTNLRRTRDLLLPRLLRGPSGTIDGTSPLG